MTQRPPGMARCPDAPRSPAPADEPAPGGIFDSPLPLPRGPHRLSEEQVAESQRIRLMSSLTVLMAERGYARVTIGEVVRRAGVSRTTFYTHFTDKQDCLFAAYDRFAAFIAAAIDPTFDADAPWRTFIETTFGRYLSAFERDFAASRAFLVEMDAAGPAARQRRRESLQGFATLLALCHAAVRYHHPELGPLPQRAYLTFALAVRELVHESLEQEPAPKLTELAPDLTIMVAALFEGAAAAAAAP